MKKIILILIILILSIGAAYGDNNTTNTIDTKNIIYDYNTTTALESGDSNISFANNMTGYCIEYREYSATENDTFYVANTSYIKNNQTNEDVSNYIKTFFVYFYNDTISNNLTYRGEPVNQTIFNQHIIWYFTDNLTSPITENSSELIYRIIKHSNQIKVSDNGYLKINKTTIMKYNFCTLLASYEHHQNFFGYQIWFENIINNQTNETKNNTNNITNIIQNNTNNTNNTNNITNTNQINRNKTNPSTQNTNIIIKKNKIQTKYIDLHYKTGNPILSFIVITIFVCSILLIRRE